VVGTVIADQIFSVLFRRRRRRRRQDKEELRRLREEG
jgi:hypothetical protein